MDIMGEFPEVQGVFIVMDNVSTQAPFRIDPIIIKKGYTPVYLPPYPLELCAIE